MSELIYGRRAVLETLRANRRRLYRLWLEGERPAQPGDTLFEIRQAAEQQGVPLRPIQGGLFDKLARERVNTQGVALEAGDYPYVTVADCLRRAREVGEPPLLLLLDHLHDPQNLGTLMRTAEAMGVHGVIIPERRSAQVTPAVSNASAGAVEHLLVAQVNNLNRTIEELKKENIWVAGLDSAPEVPSLEQANLAGALAVVVGNEAEGLTRLARERCDFLVRLPMFGQVDSLNAAVAGSIVLYAARQARLIAK
ncbi:MAG: 23S rRNA (guanosine(2251)-2'-O)-methyltransferase RlmB [Chloroflexi bacterium]|nr:MAG: 23S rRNA (guanosine(2251)-2'-O)-methyltransferase RlmB [Chloroflexota bacterium]